MRRSVRRFDWKRSVFTALALAAAEASVALFPVYRIRLAQAHELQVKAAYFGGLRPCGSDGEAFERLVQTYLPYRPDLSIEEHPTLALAPRTIRIVGERVYLLEFDGLRWDENAPLERRSWIVDAPPHVASAALSAATRNALNSLFASDIRHAQPAEDFVLDGVVYRYRVPGVGCGYTNSPPFESRAGKLTHLYALLVLHTRLTQPEAIESSEREIRTWANDLRVDQ